MSSPFHIMAKPTGPLCNLDCAYCFYLEKEKLYPGKTNWKMPPVVLENYIRQYISSQPTASVQFAWQGGEPTLLGVEFFRDVIRLQKKYANGRKIENALQTNGVLLDGAWAEFLAENDFLVGLSIDGPRKFHDRFRVDKGGQATFNKVMNGLQVLKDYRVRFNTLTVVNRVNAYQPLAVYRFLKQIGSPYMQFIPVVERRTSRAPHNGLQLVQPAFEGDTEVTPWSVEPVAFGRFLSTIFDEWVRRDVGRHYVQIFEVALEIWYGIGASLCVFKETCGSAMALEHSGDLFSCDHFVYPENKLGNIVDVPIQELATSLQQRKFGFAKRDTLPRVCRECDVRFACNGECPKHRFLHTADGEPGLNYLCQGYKNFFRHIDPYMKYMVRELREDRAPANIMRYLSSGRY